jgi:hypothetical protein
MRRVRASYTTLIITVVRSRAEPELVVVNMSHTGQSTRVIHVSQNESELSAQGARWVRKSQLDSGGYLAFNLANAQCKYISLPIVFDQSTQLVPGAGGDTAPPLERCSVIDMKSTSVSTVSSDDIDGGGDGGVKDMRSCRCCRRTGTWAHSR